MFGHATYLIFELAWGLPVLAIQWIAGSRRLWTMRRIILTAVVLATTYLSLADSFAIAVHIWRLHTDRIVNIRVVNLPIEEIIFFLLTNAMVAQSVVLVLPGWPFKRWRGREEDSAS